MVLVELQDGRWYAVALGWRLIDGAHGLLGRETFLVPVDWETEPHVWKDPRLTFPVISPATGRIELQFPMPFPATRQRPSTAFVDEFDSETLGIEWNVRRTHAEPFHSLSSRAGALRLFLRPARIAARTQYSFVGARQRHFRFEAVTEMRFRPAVATESQRRSSRPNRRIAIHATA